jgi:hypothetical protein
MLTLDHCSTQGAKRLQPGVQAFSGRAGVVIRIVPVRLRTAALALSEVVSRIACFPGRIAISARALALHGVRGSESHANKR